ncbi:shikimate 5-dehydrogenase [Tropicimonas sp. IMCC34043]|uniref:shikimate 5-dehydrogenase n=1 Tax=Tropicimonas sp. IMCC34043 TaxID=2248760 RepID=UPI000E27E86D|nr:shikimate 5-dehydrogenase [Tropicimonas sp. IMCC34043]
MTRITKDTRLCMSLSARPGNHGTRFHNFLYEELGLNYVYKAFSTTDLPAAIGGIRALGIRGCAISMPFKEACIPLVDELMPSAAAIQSVNTIVNDDGVLRAYNTDYTAVETLIAQYRLNPDMRLVLRGSGGMAKAVASAFRDAGFRNGTIVARNAVAGPELARISGFDWRAEAGGLDADLLVNVTPIGMAGGEDADALAFTEAAVDRAEAVFDVVALPPETPLVRMARAKGKVVIAGDEVIALQAVAQFELYTGVRPTDDQFRRAREFAAQPA